MSYGGASDVGIERLSARRIGRMSGVTHDFKVTTFVGSVLWTFE